MLCVAIPLAAADLFVKATEPTQPWAYHQRSYGWLVLSVGTARGHVRWSRRSRPCSSRPLQAFSPAGILGNSLSAAWNDMQVPNPLRDRRRPTRSIAFNLADVWALAGILAARARDRHLADPEPRPAAADGTKCAPRAGRAFGGSSSDSRSLIVWTNLDVRVENVEYDEEGCR